MDWKRAPDYLRNKDHTPYQHDIEINKKNGENKLISNELDYKVRIDVGNESRYTPLRTTPQFILQRRYPRTYSSAPGRFLVPSRMKFPEEEIKGSIINSQLVPSNQGVQKNRSNSYLQEVNINQINYAKENDERRYPYNSSREEYQKYEGPKENYYQDKERDEFIYQRDKNNNAQYQPQREVQMSINERERNDNYKDLPKENQGYIKMREQRYPEEYYRRKYNRYLEKQPVFEDIKPKSQTVETSSIRNKEIQREGNFYVNNSRPLRLNPENIIYTPYRNDYLRSHYGDYTYNYYLNAPMRGDITEDWKYPPQYYYFPRYYDRKAHTYENK